MSNRNRGIFGSSTGWARRVESGYKSIALDPLVTWEKPYRHTRGKIESSAAFGSIKAIPISLSSIAINQPYILRWGLISGGGAWKGGDEAWYLARA